LDLLFGPRILGLKQRTPFFFFSTFNAIVNAYPNLFLFFNSVVLLWSFEGACDDGTPQIGV
jgi:hypothetical protein